ncbi:oxygenase MpaB family protein [Actinoallomurus soli]|uniref:oxygenase MpaB family protein n=1 Tax=Actinoallomurus soli TaxID=2952535 RepID=UPI0020939CEA|nr:oxygenase MpaB family protein [Actinoallomurus soli]MCO5967860.1 oxygenase MpaB family protein [Actinoallomurus soli]
MATTEPVPFDGEAIVGAALLAGGANVIMQLARPGVGYGVIESRVESGQLHRHPIKRARTTFSYLAVALLGDPDDKTAYRKAVNKAHAQVRSGPSSPVSYNAFDPALQLWVAACLYRGLEDTYEAFIGPLTPAVRDRLYRSSATLGTTLQVRPRDWPADREAFEKYWREELRHVSIDDPVRRHLLALADLRFLPRPVSALLGGFNRFVTTGFLPPEFRAPMGLPWNARDQRRFDRLIAVLRVLTRLQPVALRRFPFNVLLWDVRRRVRTGRPLV